MKKGIIVLIALVAIAIFWGVGVYNGLVFETIEPELVE